MKWTRHGISSAALALTIAGLAGDHARKSAAGTTPPGVPADEKAIETPSQKLALLVGINQYKSDKIPPLLGAVNDVVGMRDLLVGRFGFRAEDVVVKTDADATHEAIVRAFHDHLIARADERTVALFYFSGYGSRMKDVDGDELDGWDETIVPYDSRQGSVFDIDDDEQGELFGALRAKTRYVTAIFDCGLGPISRQSFQDMARPPGFAGGRELLPVSAQRPRVRGLAHDDRPRPASRPPASKATHGHASARIFASDEGEQAYEARIGDRACGIFSHFLAQELAAAGQETYRDILDRALFKVQRLQPAQRPILDGEGADSVPFGTQTHPTPPYLLATMDGLQVTVLAGRIQGLTTGSTFDIYPPGSKEFRDPRAAIARIRLREVGILDAKAELISGRAIPTASRAVERDHKNGERRIRLYLDEEHGGSSPTLAAVRRYLGSKATLGGTFELVHRGDKADYLLRRKGGSNGRPGLISLLTGDGKDRGSIPEGTPRVTEHILEQVILSEGMPSSSTRQVLPPPDFTYPAKIHGLFIGIDKYGNSEAGYSFLNLQGCVNDAKDMSAGLRELTDMHFSLSDQEATKEAILNHLSIIVDQSQPNDLIVVFISSHGTIAYNDYYVVPHDIDSRRILTTGLPFSVIIDCLNSKRGLKSLVILDSCHSGRSSFNVARYSGEDHETSIMVSCGPNELSMETSSNGFFTGNLIKGLRGPADDNGDGKITVRELFDYAYFDTKKVSRGRQHPVFFGSLNQNIILRNLSN